MSLQAQVKKPAPVAANDDNQPKTAWRGPQQQHQQQQGGMSPVLRLINRGQQESGKICL